MNINDSGRKCAAASEIPHPIEVHQEMLLGGPWREKAVPQGLPSPPRKETRHSVGNSVVLAPSGMFRPRARGGVRFINLVLRSLAHTVGFLYALWFTGVC